MSGGADFFFFAAFEFCRVAMIRHTVDNAVYEGARIGIIPGATSTEAEDEAARILTTIGITDFDVTVTPSTIDKVLSIRSAIRASCVTINRAVPTS